MERQWRINLKALAGSLAAAAIVVADSDNYGPDGFPWWANLLLFLATFGTVYGVWSVAFPEDSDARESTKQSTQLIVAGLVGALLLVLILFLSTR